MNDELWIDKIKITRESEFNEQYLNPFPPQTFLDWVESFCKQLDCPPPNSDGIAFGEYMKRLGAWETQMKILEKLKYAVKAERQKTNNDNI